MSKEIFLGEAARLAEGYQPNADVQSFAAGLELVTILGPTGVGKDTLMQASGLPIAKGCTSRDPRPSEIAAPGQSYDFVITTDQQNQLIDDLENGRLVQANVHPTTGEFYGSRPHNFPDSGVVLFDALPRQHYEFEADELFGAVSGVYVTVPTYAEWQRRLATADRSSASHLQRMAEARDSLSMCLDDPDLYFLVNHDIDMAVADLHAVATENAEIAPVQQHMARWAGRSMLYGLVNDRPAGQ